MEETAGEMGQSGRGKNEVTVKLHRTTTIVTRPVSVFMSSYKMY